MSRNSGKKSDSAGKGSPLMVGLLLGLIVGVALAAGLAWYLMKSPSPFVSKEPVVSRPAVEEQHKAAAMAVVKPAVPLAASGVADGKPRFEFYKVLTDKQDSPALPSEQVAKTSANKVAVPKPAVEVAKVNTDTSKPEAAKQIYFLQTGAFSNEAEAEKMKASLIFDGMEVTVLAVNSPDKGLLHKVRVGPYQGADEMNSVRAKLKLKGIASTPIHGQ